MKHKELIASIAAKINQPETEVDAMLDTTVEIIKTALVEGHSISFQGFGSLEFKRREERISVHPATQVRTLVPPKQVVNFRPSTTFKNKLKESLSHE